MKLLLKFSFYPRSESTKLISFEIKIQTLLYLLVETAINRLVIIFLKR